MTRIGTFILAVALVAFAGSTVSAREWKSIRIATEGEYPPFNQLDAKDQPIGFDVDIAKALCQKMGATCSFEVLDWDALIPSLNAGKVDAIVSSMAITPERRRQVAFTNRYYDRPTSFVARKDSKIAAWDAAGLKDKVVGVMANTAQAAFLQAEIQAGGAQIKLYGSQAEANADLVTGRLDAVLADKLVLAGWLAKPESLCCEIKADVDVADYPSFFGEGEGIALRKSDGDLVEKFNKAIADIVADGTYKTINDKYFPFSIY
ncbi:transporter substrate-binding domain-containing protein [Labrys sp. KB_33_2]|uniref:transporter substrate-binding domain-containing protein n=1 Tax=Labrys sp. KB_33_2 TaxID=3237479 RepID=UPI003F90F6C3